MRTWTAFLLTVAACPMPSIATAQDRVHCPNGQVVESVNFKKQSLRCVPLPIVSGSSGALRVVDSGGQTVSMLIGISLFARQFDGVWYAFPAFLTGFGESGISFYYESSDCTGTDFVLVDKANAPQSVPYRSIGGSAATFYLPRPGTVTTRSFSSTRNIIPTGSPDTCQSAAFSADSAVPMPFTVNTTLPWRVTD